MSILSKIKNLFLYKWEVAELIDLTIQWILAKVFDNSELQSLLYFIRCKKWDINYC